MNSVSNRGLLRSILVVSALLGAGGTIYFVFTNVTCFVLWAYGVALLPFSYFVHTGAVGARLARRVLIGVVVLSVLAPWPYLRWTDRPIEAGAALESLEPVGPCDCVRLRVDEEQLQRLTGFDVEGAVDWELCEEGLADFLEPLTDKGRLQTQWEISYASEFLAPWQLYSYGLKRVGERSALEITGQECSE